VIERFTQIAAGCFSPTWVKASLLLSLMATSLLLAVCAYLARATRKGYFGLWMLGGTFFVGHLALSLALHHWPTLPVLAWAQLSVLGMSGVFLLLGMFDLTERPCHSSMMTGLMVAVWGWSYFAAFHLPPSWWNATPVLGVLVAAYVWAGVHFARERPASRASGLLTVGWFGLGLGTMVFAYVGVVPAGLVAGHVGTALLMLLVAMALMLREEATYSEDKYRSLIESTTDALFVVDLWTQQVLDVNKSACRLTKYPREELLKRTFLELCPDLRKNGDSLLDLRNMFNAVFKPHSEFHILRADHGPVICEGDASLSQWRKRAVIQLTVREVDKSRTTNQLMRRTEKLSSLGQLVAGVAHELNNPLAVVMGYAQVIAKHDDLDEKHRDNILRILHESERAAKIVRDLLSFARPCDPQLQPVDVNRLICNVLDIRETDLRDHQIQDQVYLASDLPRTKADPIQMEQVINNLISNAIHALDSTPAAERRLKITSEISGFFIRVTITDSGPGIPHSVRDRIFDPFFTTKAPGKGTGLGLSISNTIMQEHHGRIWFESEVGKWTEFYLELPIVSCDEEVKPAPKPVDGRPQPVVLTEIITGGPTERRLLVVDDEPGIREVLKDVLLCSGYLVDTAANGNEALKQLTANRYDLIISDLCMPEMDGEALFQKVRDTDVQLASRIIFVTGDTVSPKSREFLDETGNRWLSKPFNIRDVEDTVKTVLGKTIHRAD